jgi:hypothetical protein
MNRLGIQDGETGMLSRFYRRSSAFIGGSNDLSSTDEHRCSPMKKTDSKPLALQSSASNASRRFLDDCVNQVPCRGSL